MLVDRGGPTSTTHSPTLGGAPGSVAYASAAFSESSRGVSAVSPPRAPWTLSSHTTRASAELLPKGSVADDSAEYIDFYSHHGQHGFLSQFFEAPFEHEGASYGTAEKYMMAAKARLMGDSTALAHIMATQKLDDAKKLGRRIKPWNMELWQTERFGTICQGTVLEFSQNSELREALLRTGDATLVDASLYDRIWGVGISVADAEAGVPWRGMNLLGLALGRVRDKLRAEDAAAGTSPAATPAIGKEYSSDVTGGGAGAPVATVSIASDGKSRCISIASKELVARWAQSQFRLGWPRVLMPVEAPGDSHSPVPAIAPGKGKRPYSNPER